MMMPMISSAIWAITGIGTFNEMIIKSQPSAVNRNKRVNCGVICVSPFIFKNIIKIHV